MKVGVIVNPIAGVGAALAWKGTDNVSAAWDAINRGEYQPVWNILTRALKSIEDLNNLSFFFAFDSDELINSLELDYIDYSIVFEMPLNSSSIHTKEATEVLIRKEVDIIIFVGGDGTALDIGDVTSDKVPIVGIPGGVKIFSPTFLHRPEDLNLFLRSWDGQTKQVDLLDLDEEEYKKGFAKPILTGTCKIPVYDGIQNSKMSWSSVDESIHELIAQRISDDNLLLEKRILIGPGSTMKSIFAYIGCDLSLLGVDLIVNGDLVLKDCTRGQIIENNKNISIDEIWLSPIGSQGHIFGRGNRQIPSEIINQVGKKSIILFSSYDKIENTKIIYVDSGDPKVDELLTGYHKVIIGYHDEIIRKIVLS
jgi:predicted polyphosphate/ATP-dependent NAD kinase